MVIKRQGNRWIQKNGSRNVKEPQFIRQSRSKDF